MSVDDSECTVSGVGADGDGLLCDIAGSDDQDDQKCLEGLLKTLA